MKKCVLVALVILAWVTPSRAQRKRRVATLTAISALGLLFRRNNEKESSS
jgi:hypothetical protein